MEGPTRLMDRFISLAVEYYENGEDLAFDNPVGFRYMQRYRKEVKGEFYVMHQGERRECTLIVDRNGPIRKDKIKSATAANITHSFDAALLTEIVLRGDYDKLVIHDSFSSVAADADKLFEDTRLAAIDMFQEDLLEKCLGITDVDLGMLDVNKLKDNEFFAS